MPALPILFDADILPAGLSRGEAIELVHFDVRAALVRPALRPRPHDAAALVALWEEFLERDAPLLGGQGIEPFVVLGVPPDAMPERGLALAFHRLAPLLGRRRVVAVGPAGLWGAGGAEEHALRRHVELSRETNRPLVVHLGRRAPAAGLERLLCVLGEEEADPARVLIVGPGAPSFRVLREHGFPVALRPAAGRLSVGQVADLVNLNGSEGILLASGAGGGHGDLLAVPKVLAAMKTLGMPRSALRRVAARNAAAFFRIDLGA